MNRSSCAPLLTSLAVTASAGAITLAGASCGSTLAQFTGTERPAVVSADEVIDFGVDPPEGHEVIGVASVRCETSNGASGLFEVPCTEEAMTGLLRERAADAGGTGLVETRCEKPDARRVLADVDGGSVQQSTLSGLICHATVVRRGEGVVVGARPQTASGPQQDGAARRVTISGQPVEVGADQPPSGPPSSNVGELDAFPEGYVDRGRIWSRCLHGCARSHARRALLEEAARRGAQAIAALGCTLEGERWRCAATLVGGPTAPSPGATSPLAEPSADGRGTGGGGEDRDGAGGAAPSPAITPEPGSPPRAPGPPGE